MYNTLHNVSARPGDQAFDPAFVITHSGRYHTAQHQLYKDIQYQMYHTYTAQYYLRIHKYTNMYCILLPQSTNLFRTRGLSWPADSSGRLLCEKTTWSRTGGAAGQQGAGGVFFRGKDS